jgi:myo-inositol 2-dehydrogenase/D-chiro-inositol 1-dehydrogenase
VANVRFGLVGYGAWGSHHAAAIAKTPGAELVAVAARSDESQAAARQAFPDVDVVGDYRRLVERKDIDVVDVVVPSYLHCEIGCAVLESGKHLLLEKPMAVSLAECDRLIAVANRAERVVAIGHEMRLSSLWGRAKELIDDGVVGEPRYVLVELSRRPYRLGASGWRYDISRVGNWILEEPIHFFDLARWYLGGIGEPTHVYARANSRQPDHPELQDNFSAMLHFPKGVYAVISQTLAAFEHHQTVKVTGTRGALWAGWSGAMDRTLHPTFFLKYFDGTEVREATFERAGGEVFELEDEMAMMVRVVRDGATPAATASDGRWSVGLCLAAQESADRGTVISLEDLNAA